MVDTQYESLWEIAERLASMHPKSYLLIDVTTGKLVASSMNPDRLAEMIPDNVQGFMIYKKHDPKQVWI